MESSKASPEAVPARHTSDLSPGQAGPLVHADGRAVEVAFQGPLDVLPGLDHEGLRDHGPAAADRVSDQPDLATLAEQMRRQREAGRAARACGSDSSAL